MDSLLPEPCEWTKAVGSMPHDQIHAARQLLWALRPPLSKWLALPDPETFWTTAREFLSSLLGHACGPCPRWWMAAAPIWDDVVLRVVVRTQTRLRTGLFEVPQIHPHVGCHYRPQSVHVGHKDESAAIAISSLKMPELGGDVAEDAEDSNDRKVGHHEDIGEPAPKRRRGNAFHDMLRRDAAWTDGLLRGVALVLSR